MARECRKHRSPPTTPRAECLRLLLELVTRRSTVDAGSNPARPHSQSSKPCDSIRRKSASRRPSASSVRRDAEIPKMNRLVGHHRHEERVSQHSSGRAEPMTAAWGRTEQHRGGVGIHLKRRYRNSVAVAGASSRGRAPCSVRSRRRRRVDYRSGVTARSGPIILHSGRRTATRRLSRTRAGSSVWESMGSSSAVVTGLWHIRGNPVRCRALNKTLAARGLASCEDSPTDEGSNPSRLTRV